MSKEINGIIINSSHIRVHELIRRWSKNGGFCWANNTTIAEKLSLSRSYVSHLITDLNRAGLVGRKLTFSDRREFEMRQLMSFDEKDVLTVEQADARVEERAEKNEKRAEKNRLMHNARLVNIAPSRVAEAIAKFGAEKVDEALSIVRASNSVANPYAYFCAALKKGWKAGTRAAKLMKKEFSGGVKRTLSKPAKEDEAEAKAMADIKRAKDNQVNDGKKVIHNDFLRQVMKMRTGRDYVIAH